MATTYNPRPSSIISTGSDVFYRYPELYQIRNARTGKRILNCSSYDTALAQYKKLKAKLPRQETTHLEIIKLNRKEELKWNLS